MTYNLYHTNVYNQLLHSNINLYDKNILDIGSRDGINCISMIKLGAKNIIGIDLDDTQFSKIDEYEEKNKITLIKSNILNLNYQNKFDIVTCFLWNFNLPDYHKIFNKIKSLVNPDGLILIGIHDDLYKYGYKNLTNTGSVIELINSHFNNYSILDNKDPFQWIIKIKMDSILN